MRTPHNPLRSAPPRDPPPRPDPHGRPAGPNADRRGGGRPVATAAAAGLALAAMLVGGCGSRFAGRWTIDGQQTARRLVDATLQQASVDASGRGMNPFAAAGLRAATATLVTNAGDALNRSGVELTLNKDRTAELTLPVRPAEHDAAAMAALAALPALGPLNPAGPQSPVGLATAPAADAAGPARGEWTEEKGRAFIDLTHIPVGRGFNAALGTRLVAQAKGDRLVLFPEDPLAPPGTPPNGGDGPALVLRRAK